ncbi:MAG: 4-(cytidine 5'-diphospho)-2-C-methyl-D-erythritol kinase [Alphaproteobacteria bacterium]|nr:4-(cytidine 5'-diphospho)-2-C-methyl-D-erythritol kinase [Alphaproteobacteria bacterium]
MTSSRNSKKNKLTVFAPAKVNLFLHITGKRIDGFHTLESLIAFADIGEKISIEPHSHFEFSVCGPYVDRLEKEHRQNHLDSQNLVVKAARALSQVTDQPLNCRIKLEKSLPIASGLGGGSSDAAATIWGLQRFLGLSQDTEYLIPLMTKLGADIPVCYFARSAFVSGIGDKIEPCYNLPEMPIVLVNPNISCSTKNVFLQRQGSFKKEISKYPNLNSFENLFSFLSKTQNDLYNAAVETVPEIANVMFALETQTTCLFHRMSGSGATCFGLFETAELAKKAANEIQNENPDWWVQDGMLNTIERY